jgi:hypothetical protein
MPLLVVSMQTPHLVCSSKPDRAAWRESSLDSRKPRRRLVSPRSKRRTWPGSSERCIPGNGHPWCFPWAIDRHRIDSVAKRAKHFWFKEAEALHSVVLGFEANCLSLPMPAWTRGNSWRSAALASSQLFPLKFVLEAWRALFRMLEDLRCTILNHRRDLQLRIRARSS